MNWGAVGAVAELLGAVGVIVSLIYLASQVRSAGQLQQQEAARSVMAKLNDTMKYLASEHEKADLWVRGSGGFSKLKDQAEIVQFSGFMISFFRTYEELYFYRQAGIDWDWSGFESQVRATINAPGVREWWTTRSHYFSEEFQAEIERYLQDPIKPLYGEETDNNRTRLEEP